MAAEKRIHTLYGFFRQVLAVHDVTSAGNADLSAATAKFTPPF
jgi:hypothetical protein